MQTTHRPQPQTSFSMMGIDVSVLATGDDTQGSWEGVLQTVRPGGGSPLHTIQADKLFLVLEGEVVLVIDGEEHVSRPGASATVAAGVAHRFENRSDSAVRLAVITSGGGHVDFLAGLAELAAGGPPEPAALQAHAARHHVELLVAERVA